MPLAIAGIAILLWRSGARVRWMPVILFTLTYFYILSTHSHVFGRYALAARAAALPVHVRRGLRGDRARRRASARWPDPRRAGR